MTELSVATTVNPRFDHVTLIEATQSSVTVTHRCQVFAELMAVARSGLVDIVLIADDFELVRLETLQQVLDAQGHGPKVAAISDVVDDRDRLAALGIPVASTSLTGPELVDWLRQIHQVMPEAVQPESELSVHDLRILEALDPETPSTRRSGRRAAPYDPTTDLPEFSSLGDAADQTALPIETFESHAHENDQEPEDLGHPEATEHASQTEVRIGAPARKGHLTAVWGPIGAPGATTVAVNLAVESALEGHRTLIVDANTYGAAVAVHLGLLDDTAAIAQACRAIEHRGIDAVELADYAQHVKIEGHHLDVITGLTRSERWPQLRATAWEQLLDIARNGWDHVIIDCGFGLETDEELSFDIPAPQRNATTVSAVCHADTVLAVGTGDPVGFVRFMKSIEQLMEVTTQRVVPVVNKVSSMTSGIGPKRQLAAVWERFGPKVALQHFIPWAPDLLAAALMEGKTLAERAPKTEIRQAIRQVLPSCVSAPAIHATRVGVSSQTKPRWSFRHVVARVKDRAGRGA
jgi:MinD-like ATPase involved in chromosome partitioning or flagellar assembly